MAKLTKEVQAFVVQQLACFHTPSEVAAAVSEMFGVEIGRQQTWKYSPANNPELAPKWRALFDTTRAAFIADVASIPIAHRAVRLRKLNRLVDQAEAKQQPALVAQLLRQAAEEAGGVLTNERRLSRPDGGPVVEIYPKVRLPDNGRDPIGRPPAAGGAATTESGGNRESIER